MAGDISRRSPQAAGIAANAVLTRLLDALTHKGIMNNLEVSEVMRLAAADLGKSDASVYRDAKAIVETELAPEFWD